MPRGGDGAYSLPAGTLVSTGDMLLVSQHNPAFQDVAAALTGSLDRDGNGGMRTDLDMGSHKITNMQAGTDPSDGATIGQLASGAGVPIGAVMDFAGSSPPSGWLVCGGQSLQRDEYPELFAVIGTTFGSLGGNVFSLPDLRGRVTAGRDFSTSSGTAGRLSATTMTPDGTTLGATGGAQTHTLSTSELASHQHALSGSTAPGGAHNHTVPATEGGGGPIKALSEVGVTTGSITTSTVADHSHVLSGNVAAAGGGAAHNNVQPTLLLNKIIRASTS